MDGAGHELQLAEEGGRLQDISFPLGLRDAKDVSRSSCWSRRRRPSSDLVGRRSSGPFGGRVADAARLLLTAVSAFSCEALEVNFRNILYRGTIGLFA